MKFGKVIKTLSDFIYGSLTIEWEIDFFISNFKTQKFNFFFLMRLACSALEGFSIFMNCLFLK